MFPPAICGQQRDPAEEKRLREILHRQDKNRGFLVAFEGPDGSGKTTQRKLF